MSIRSGRTAHLLHEQLAGELLQHAALTVRLGKGVVFLGRTARQGLKPVGIVVRTVLQRPLAHTRRDAVGNFARERRAFFHRVEQGRIGALVEILPHGRTSEYLLSEVVRRASLGNFHLDGRVIYGRIDHLESE